MSVDEYRNAILRAAQISYEINIMLDERGLDLFEEYGSIYESIIRSEISDKYGHA